jgi:multiple sugar transport system permease protein
MLIHQTSYLRWGLNTLIFATSVTLITLVIDTLAGYAFARLHFPGRSALFALVLTTLMIPTAVIVAPLYIIVSHFPSWTHAGVNTYPGMILPMVCTPLGVYMMRQFMSTLPEGLVEAARLDGASELQILRKIVLPLMKPAIVVLGIFTFMSQWVNFLWPLVITSTDSMKTLTVGIASLQGQFVTNWGVISAASVATMVPIIIVFLIFQRWFVQASMAGALKQ